MSYETLKMIGTGAAIIVFAIGMPLMVSAAERYFLRKYGMDKPDTPDV